MGWTRSPNWKSTKEAIAEESRCNDKYEKVWQSGSSIIYRCKEDGHFCHNYFLTSRIKHEIAVKDIGDFRAIAAAKKFVALVNASGVSPDLSYQYKDALAFIEKDRQMNRLHELPPDATVYLNCYDEETEPEGKCRFVHWTRSKRQLVVVFPGSRFYRVNKSMIDLEKTFGKPEEPAVKTAEPRGCYL